MVVQTFYSGIMHAMRSMIDMESKTKVQAYNLIKEMEIYNYKSSTKRLTQVGWR